MSVVFISLSALLRPQSWRTSVWPFAPSWVSPPYVFLPPVGMPPCGAASSPFPAPGALVPWRWCQLTWRTAQAPGAPEVLPPTCCPRTQKRTQTRRVSEGESEESVLWAELWHRCLTKPRPPPLLWRPRPRLLLRQHRYRAGTGDREMDPEKPRPPPAQWLCRRPIEIQNVTVTQLQSFKPLPPPPCNAWPAACNAWPGT